MCSYDYEMALKHVSPLGNHLALDLKNVRKKVKEYFSKIEPLRICCFIFNCKRIRSTQIDASNTLLHVTLSLCTFSSLSGYAWFCLLMRLGLNNNFLVLNTSVLNQISNKKDKMVHRYSTGYKEERNTVSPVNRKE